MRRLLLLALILLGAGTGVQADITTGLIGWWPFDNDALDASGNGNHGSIVGGLVPTTDRFGAPNAAYLFNGTNSYVLVPNSASLSSPDTALTQAAWVNIYGVSLVGDPFAPILMKSIAAANAFQYRMYTVPTYFGVSFNNWLNSYTGLHAFTLNQWYHMVSVLDGSGVRFYVNGTPVHSHAVATTILPGAHDLTIGADFPGILEIFYGKIDDVRLYARALTDEDVAELYDGYASGVGDTPPAARSTIRAIYPNPMSANTTVEFFLESPSEVNVSVYDVSGRLVRTLRAARLQAGAHTGRWDGRDASGELVPSGVYFVRLKAGGATTSKRTILVR